MAESFKMFVITNVVILIDPVAKWIRIELKPRHHGLFEQQRLSGMSDISCGGMKRVFSKEGIISLEMVNGSICCSKINGFGLIYSRSKEENPGGIRFGRDGIPDERMSLEDMEEGEEE